MQIQTICMALADLPSSRVANVSANPVIAVYFISGCSRQLS
jgi:hypothetical protein